MKFEELIEGIRRILIYVRKPDRDEYTHMLKITLLGFTLAGSIGLAISVALGYLMQIR